MGTLTTTIPPPRYDHVYRGPVMERLVSAGEMAQFCGGVDEACATLRHGTCYIYYSQKRLPALTALIRRHEMGHCNGWPGSHPDARTVTRYEWGKQKKPKHGVLLELE